MADRVLRVDRFALDWARTEVADEAPLVPGRARARVTPEGYLDADALLARDGLLRYSDGARSWLEYRPRAELEAAAASWDHAPVTDDHPPVMVDASNAAQYTRGLVTSTPRVVEVDGTAYLAATIRVLDRDLVDRILAGDQAEISIGFWADVHPEAGTLDGARYDATQRALAGNHVAVVDRGRAGPAVRVLLDRAGATCTDPVPVCYDGHVKPNREVADVSKRKIKIPTGKVDARAALADEVGMPTTSAKLVGPDGTEIEVPTWVAALVAEAIDARKAAGQDPGAEVEADESDAPPAPEPKDPAVSKPTDEPTDKPLTPDAINALVRRRGRLERLAASAGVPASVIDSADDAALARSYIATVLPHAKARADAADGDVLDALVEVAASTPAPVEANPFEVARRVDADDANDPIVAAYAAHLAR